MDRLPLHPYDFFGYLGSGLLVVVGMQFVLGFPDVLGHNFQVVDGAILFLGVYVSGQMMATPAKAVLEDIVIEKIFGRPHTVLFGGKKPRILGFLFPGYYKQLPESVQKAVLSKSASDGKHLEGESLFLHVRFGPCIRDDERLISRLSGFLNQYGFNRNLAFTSIVVGSALVLKSHASADPLLLRYGLTVLITGVVLFFRYLKFFRQYSYELFNTYARN